MSKSGETQNLLWENLQDDLADKHGLAIVLTDENSSALMQSNNNSMCRALYNSQEFASECAKFCGRAFELAEDAEETVDYKCYAGLSCKAVPLNENSAAIVGRTFLKAEDYRAATDRAISGDWQKFPPTAFFENVLLSGSPKAIEALANRLGKLSEEEKSALENLIGKNKTSEKTEKAKNEAAQTDEITKLVEQFHKSSPPVTIAAEKINVQTAEEAGESAAWRALFSSLLNLNYENAYQSIIRFLTIRYELKDLAWLERKSDRLETVFAVGTLNTKEVQIIIGADDKNLRDAARKDSAVEFREKNGQDEAQNNRTINIFPIAVGEAINNALVVGDELSDNRIEKQIARFCHSVAAQIEILRLRGELSRHNWLERAVQRFNENLKHIDSDDFWTQLAQVSAELLRAERCSLLLFDEKTETFSVKAAIGSFAEIIKNETEGIGKRVANAVLQEGKAVMVADVNKIGLRAAPAEWNYKTASFISYPIIVGTHKIGVLNVTDRADGSVYGERDLQLLNAIAPQLGVLIDRVTLKHQAGRFEQLSVTDELTGLLNRRYLEERLTEEIKRSNRYGYPMSFLMIDVDDFKSYNDTFLHPEGDKALRIVTNCLKDTLRGADVAARYGGEEFSILLPQTTPDEAQTIAERIREKVEKTEFPNRQVTVSIGIANCSHIISKSPDIVFAADKALYEAKAKGKNNVQVYENLGKSLKV
ncbi:hypothetical protein BH10ACI1_BH10ACI1_34480 [soil metagenome]